MPLRIVRNDITKMHVDAIVNTANPEPGYGSGLDSAVYTGAGADKLLKDRSEIAVMPKGTSAITTGYDLPAKYIIHTVGTPWIDGKSGEEEIVRNCYRSAFDIALGHEVESIAFPLLASGCYGFPKGIALRLALSEIEAFLSENEMEVYLVVFDEKSFSLSSELYGDIDSYINENFVEEKIKEEYCFEDRMPYASQSSMMLLGAAPRKTGNALERSERSFFRKKKGANDSAPRYEDAKSSEFAEDTFVADEEEACVPEFAAPSVKKRTLDDCLSDIQKTFMELVFSFADAKEMTDVEVQKKANLDKRAFSKLKCGNTKNPSKSTALALAVALKLNLDETKDLLSRAGLALSPCSKQDLIVQYFIEHEAYDINEINFALFEHGEPLLGSQVKE